MIVYLKEEFKFPPIKNLQEKLREMLITTSFFVHKFLFSNPFLKGLMSFWNK
jgi:hypothetical protein